MKLRHKTKETLLCLIDIKQEPAPQGCPLTSAVGKWKYLFNPPHTNKNHNKSPQSQYTHCHKLTGSTAHVANKGLHPNYTNNLDCHGRENSRRVCKISISQGRQINTLKTWSTLQPRRKQSCATSRGHTYTLTSRRRARVGEKVEHWEWRHLTSRGIYLRSHRGNGLVTTWKC